LPSQLVQSCAIFTLLWMMLWTTIPLLSTLSSIVERSSRKEDLSNVEKNLGPKGSGYREQIAELVRQIAEEEQVPYFILDSLIHHESEYNPKALSKRGAIGLTQLMPKTARMLKVNPYDPEENVRGGARYLADMLKRFGNMDTALVAYNAGPSKVRRPPRQSIRYARSVQEFARKLAPWEPPTYEENPMTTVLRGFTK
jgi:soluble lytic murein transglycosylase-like protein